MHVPDASRPRAASEDFVLTLWTDDPSLAKDADAAGIDRVGLDLETIGKRERQSGLGTWISPHDVERIGPVRDSLRRARLFARVNAVHPGTPAEVERLLGEGVEVLMLPMFRGRDEVERFSECVGGRAGIVLLLETREAADAIAEIVAVGGVGEVHVGINDFALDLGMRNRFEVYDSPLVERASRCVRDAGLRFGIGGIGRPDDDSLPLPSALLYAQYPRLGATAALISRAFTRRLAGAGALREQIARSREALARWYAASPRELAEAHAAFRSAVAAMPGW